MNDSLRKKTVVYLIRHSIKFRGPVNGNFSAFDLMQPLSAEGETRARMLMDIPELRNADFAAASTMSRSLATIRYILEADNIPYAIDERLRELDFGIKPKDMDMDSFMAKKWDEPDVQPEGGESVTQCRIRMAECIQEIVQAHPGQKILVGSHGAAICAYLSGILDCIDDDFVRSVNLPDIFKITFDGTLPTDYERLIMPFPVPERNPLDKPPFSAEKTQQ